MLGKTLVQENDSVLAFVEMAVALQIVPREYMTNVKFFSSLLLSLLPVLIDKDCFW